MKVKTGGVLCATLYIIVSMLTSTCQTMTVSNAAKLKMAQEHAKQAIESNASRNPMPQSLGLTEEDKHSELRPLFEQMSTNEKRHLITPVTFENDIPDLLRLTNQFADQPELAQQFVRHFSFAINGIVIEPGQKKRIPIRVDKPFQFSIIAKRGKLASLLALIQSSVVDFKETMTDQIRNICFKVLDILSFHITYDCTLEEHQLCNTTHYMADLLCDQAELKPVLENPTSETLLNLVQKDRLGWPDWLDISVHLPQLRKAAS